MLTFTISKHYNTLIFNTLIRYNNFKKNREGVRPSADSKHSRQANSQVPF